MISVEFCAWSVEGQVMNIGKKDFSSEQKQKYKQ
jgi:hypothetical protein